MLLPAGLSTKRLELNTLMTIVYVLLAILIFGVLIAVHEFGHFLAAKLCNVKVNEFSVGMGPALWKRQKGETLYALRAVPLGGYCAMEGEEEASDDPRSYSSKSNLQKIAILLAGVTMNVLIAILVVTISYSISGIPTNTLSEVTAGSPAAEAGLQGGDTITEIDGMAINSWNDVLTAVDQYHEGDRLDVVYTHEGKTREAFITPELDAESGRYMIGIVAGYSRSPAKCIPAGIAATWNMNKGLGVP